ncbi:MAG: zinc ribbon domain-containing protein [Promethearchaeota archaeon]|nr:MAG: zinc ribbon domain-containing protein [Candidatus Lokiarchaeota archaeon]
MRRYFQGIEPTLEKEINQYITLKLEDGKTFIYVNGRRFIQCIRLVLNIQKDDIPLYDEIESIDEAAKVYNNHVYQNRIVRGPMAAPVPNQSHDITPEEEFWGHCSNLQAWVENDYDTRILMSNISFPLLRALSKAGDPVANRVYKEEIALRLEGGYPSVVQYILAQGYLGEFSPDEFETILASTGLIEKLSSKSKVLTSFLSACFRKFPTLSEKIILQILNFPNSEDILLSIIKRDISPHKSLGFLPYFTQSNATLFLTHLKNVFVSLLQQGNEDIREKILNCVHAIEEQLSKYDGNSILDRRSLYNDRFQFIKNHMINNNALEQFDGEQIKAKALQAKNIMPSRCKYCGKVIPKDEDFCEWCGHNKDDDDKGGFFPYPFIFKPPGGGGSMKAVAVIRNKSAT